MTIAAFVLAGFVSGLVSGGLGVGGAIIATPLVRALGMSPYLAIGTTVPAILPSALVGAFTYWRQGLVRKAALPWVAAPAALASIAGALTTRAINGHILMLATAGLLFVLALRILPTHGSTPQKEHKAMSPGPAHYVTLGIATGFLSGLLGVGGGFLMIPVFIKTFGFPPKEALGTSLAIIALTVVPNVITQTYVGNIDWTIAGLLALGVIPGARLGAITAIKTADQRLLRFVASSLLVIAVVYAALEVAALSRP
ncbi:MAG: sulfite exporter TauE/SafE family protein [Actinomycetota bacterium]